MTKRKHPEEPTAELDSVVEETVSGVQVEEPLVSEVVEGWVIGAEPAESEEEVAVTTVDPELECETSWEVEAFWALLARAGYVRW